jgi:excinuclease UvrABC nuclease subunit
VVGLSKFSGDKLVFLSSSVSFQKKVNNIKNNLLLARDEAHRFANRARVQKKAKLFKIKI